MKKILLLLLLPLGLVAQKKPSGLFSANGQQTCIYPGGSIPNVYYSSVDEFIEHIYDGKLPSGITSWNGYWHGDRHLTHDRAFFEPHAQEMSAITREQIQDVLDSVNTSRKGDVFGPGPVNMSQNRAYLTNHIKIVEVTSTKNMWLWGPEGTFKKGGWVEHVASGPELYYALVTDDGKAYLIARVSCFNPVTKSEAFWLLTGDALAFLPAKQEENAYVPDAGNGPDARNVSVNGKNMTIPAGSNITINVYGGAGGTGGTASVGDVTARNGNVNANISNEGFEKNPNYGGGNTTTPVPMSYTTYIAPPMTTQPMMMAQPTTTYAQSVPMVQNWGMGTGTGFLNNFLNGNTIVIGGGGNYGNSPCYGGGRVYWVNPNPNPNPRPIPNNYLHSMGTTTSTGLSGNGGGTGGTYHHSMGASTSYGTGH